MCARAKSIQYTHTIDVLIISEWAEEADCLLASQAFLTYRIKSCRRHNVDTHTEKSERKREKSIILNKVLGLKTGPFVVVAAAAAATDVLLLFVCHS